MDVFRQRKTKRLNIRVTPEDHSWLFSFAKRRKTKVSKLFAQFIEFLRHSEEEREEDADDEG
jgi:hypothetical protein